MNFVSSKHSKHVFENIEFDALDQAGKPTGQKNT